MENCTEYKRLQSYVENVLGNLAQLTTLHLELFRAGDFSSCKRIDKDVELTVGEKERAIGALRQHMLEHKCQPIEPI
jgi:hypothetical protein